MQKIRQSIVDEARSWLGIPFKHQGRTIDGVDCVGLVIVVAHALGLSDFETHQYSRHPSPTMMGRILDAEMVRIKISEALPGDVYWMRFFKDPQHLAIISDKGIIHSFSNVKKVTEHRIDKRWKNRIMGAYRFKGLN
ncbi:MAG: hypothetical protein GY750_15350 [Lentisphaerae bacterium]|nr:hypothetical protein [Lentisphaerota bacterium]